MDDNLIGNKKAIKEILKDVVDWQVKHGYPLTFVTEGRRSIRRDDPELMHRPWSEANILAVFMGIEHPWEESAPARPRSSRTSAAGGRSVEKVTACKTRGSRSGAG